MPIEFTCSSCGKTLRVPDELVGKQVKCSSCKHTFLAATNDAPAPPEPEEGIREGRRSSHRRSDDDDDDRPRRSSRRDDDDFDDGPPRSRGTPHRGGMIMTLGLISLITSLLSFLSFCCVFFGVLPLLGLGLGLPAWLMGQGDLAKMRDGRMDPSGRGTTQTGWICGIIGTALSLLILVAYVIFIVFYGAAMLAGGRGRGGF